MPTTPTSVVSILFRLVLSLLALPHAGEAGQPAAPAPKMTYLENGEVRVGMDLALGGAVTFLSSKDHPANIINSSDLGRQIQMSHYSGPWPFEVADKKPAKEWAGLGWNPIQTGDCRMNPSTVLEHRNDGKEIYIKCVPMQWPLDNVPGDCVFETWTSLDGPVMRMRFRCMNHRSDKTFYRPCPQELPAVYTISKLWRLMAYTGDRPFTGGDPSQVTNNWRAPWPWTRFVATEHWAALVNSEGWGLGVFKEDGALFDGGIYGDARSDNPKDSSTAYLAPMQIENFDHNIVYEHHTEFTLGNLEDIRRRFTGMADKRTPAWRFANDRKHWTLRDAKDQGFPLKGEWRISLGNAQARLESPVQCWRADDAPELELEIAYAGEPKNARIFWRRLDDQTWDTRKSLELHVNPDGQFHPCHLKLSASPEYRNLIVGMAIEPPAQNLPGGEFVIRSIVLRNNEEVGNGSRKGP